MPVVFISPPNCAGQGVTPVHYEATMFSVGTTGVYTLGLTSPGDFASYYLYAGSFDPSNGMGNCIAADNSTPKQIIYSLTQGRHFLLVVVDDDFSQSGWQLHSAVQWPRRHLPGGWWPGCDVLMPPATAVGGTFVADALVWKPGELTNPLVTIKAGNTARVLGLDASGQYYKIIWVCDFLWVPKATLGPNYDARCGTARPCRQGS